MNYLRYKLLCWAIICILNLPVFLLGADKKALVLNGIDVLVEENYKSLQGKRIGLLTNHTGRDKKGNSTIDLLFNAPEVELISLFAPEHGIRGDKDQAIIEDSKDAKTAFFKIIDNGKTELIGAKLFSGRTHQIRAHLSKINRHILGDFFYNYKGNYTQRILLHSSLLYLKHPTTQKHLKIYAPLFEDMLLFLHQNFYASQDFESFAKNFILPLQDIYLSKFT